ncbi:MAG: hypothetical protein JNK57_11300 [Planctomycetaceae bacterium]|nr:hypothetical protein [Planctomycetaceae bacterium]
MNDHDSPSEPNSQPRDSRLEAFLRRAAGILAEQRQWSAQTQIKLKMLAKELKLPPELFQTALEQLADTGRTTPPTRYEQAFCEYLERQFETLPGEILSRTQEKKALAYGQQKFQLTPDACERCIVRVAEKLNVARISDAQALSYAQGEVSRLVGKSDPSSDQLVEQVQQLALHWGIETLQAERLLQTELRRRKTKRRRAAIYRLAIVFGVGSLSLVLIVSIVVLGKVLTQNPVAISESHEVLDGKNTGKHGTSTTGHTDPTVFPIGWTNHQQDLYTRLVQKRVSPDLLAALTSENSQRRAEGYRLLWQQLTTWDRELIRQASDEPRWLRQLNVQDALLDWFWNEPDLSAAQVWLLELDRWRGGDPVDTWNTPKLGRSKHELIVDAMSDFLITTAADHLLVRVHQRCLSESKANAYQPNLQARIDAVMRLNPTGRAQISEDESDSVMASFRQRWLAGATERLSVRLQTLWSVGGQPELPDDNGVLLANASQKSITAVSESLRLIADEPTRGRLLIMFWSAIAGVDSKLAETSWPDVAAAMEVVPPRDWGPLVESWSVTPMESDWSARLLTKWQSIAQTKQRTLSGQKFQDAILVQNLLPSEPIPTRFQKQLRRELLLSLTGGLPINVPTTNTPSELPSWENLRRCVTLASCLTTESDFRTFDRIVLQSRSSADGNPTANGERAFLHAEEFDEAWRKLTTASDLESYQLAVQKLATWWQLDRILSIPQAQTVANYLLKLTKPEEQAAWLIAFHSQEVTQVPTAIQARFDSIAELLSGTSLKRLVAQPSLAIVLADHCEADWQATSLRLQWLLDSRRGTIEPRTLVDSPWNNANGDPLVRWLREHAHRGLVERDNLDRQSIPRQLTEKYRATFRTERLLPDNPVGETTLKTNSSNFMDDPLLEILLAHDQWSESLATRLLADPETWLSEYRQQVEQHASLEPALWAAEWQVLHMLQNRLTKENW